MFKNLLRISCACFLLGSATRLTAAIPSAENLLPGDTLAFFTVPDAAALRAAAGVSPQILCWNDPAMKPFHDRFMGKLNEKFIAPLEQDLGVKTGDFVDLLQGQLTVASTVNGSNGHDDVPPGLLLLLDARDKSDLLKTNLAGLQKKWADAGRPVHTETIHGLAFTVVPLNSNDFAGLFPRRAPVQVLGQEPKPEHQVNIYFTQFQSLLIAGNSIKVVEPVAAHLTGGGAPAIADDAVFAADKLAQFRDAPTYYLWFNARLFVSLISQAPEATPDADVPSPMPRYSSAKVLTALGLNGLKSASFALRESRDGSTLSIHLNAPEAARNGLLKILALPAKDASIPEFVPDTAVKFSRTRLDGKQSWAELLKMISVLSPQGLASVNAVIDMANASAQQKDPSFDLRNSLIGNLGDDLISYQKPAAGDSLDELASPASLFLLASPNPDPVIQSIRVVASMIAPQDPAQQPRDFLGHKIYSIALRSQRTFSGATAPPKPLLLAAGGGYAAFSTDPAILEEFLRSADGKIKPLRETAGIAEAAQQIGGTGGGLFGYQDQREVMRTSFKLLKNNSGNDAILRLFPASFRELLDFSLLPDYDRVTKYFYFSVFANHTTVDGLSLKVFSPRPPQLN